MESFEDHSVYLKAQPRYRELFELKPTDYKGWAYGLKRTGYATNPQYAHLLIKIIEDNKLQRFDTGRAVAIKKAEKAENSGPARLLNNHVRYVLAAKGDTYSSIAQAQGVRPAELLRYNEVEINSDKPFLGGEKVYLQPKRRKAAPGNEKVVADGVRNLYAYSQEYAIKVGKLALLNGLDASETPKEGTVLNLRKRIKDSASKQPLAPAKSNSEEHPSTGNELQFDFSL